MQPKDFLNVPDPLNSTKDRLYPQSSTRSCFPCASFVFVFVNELYLPSVTFPVSLDVLFSPPFPCMMKLLNLTVLCPRVQSLHLGPPVPRVSVGTSFDAPICQTHNYIKDITERASVNTVCLKIFAFCFYFPQLYWNLGCRRR